MATEKTTNVKVGDVVMLKSGGPRMVAQKVLAGADPAEVECAWVEGDQRVHRERFPAACLFVQTPHARRRHA